MKKLYFIIISFMFFSLFANENNQIEKIYNKPAQIDTKNASKLILKGDFIYWRAQQIGLFTSVFANKQVDLNKIAPAGNINKIEPNWEPGFKIQLGYKLDHDSWDTNLNWTWLKIKKSQNITGEADRDNDNGIFLLPLWGSGIRGPITNQYFLDRTLNLASSIDSILKIDLNILDWELEKDLFLSKNFSIKPFYGVRGLKIDQRLKMDLVSFNSSGALIRVPHAIKPRSDFLGIGPRGGIDATYDIFKNFGIYAIGSVSFLYGRFNCKYEDVYEQNSRLPFEDLINIRDKFYNSISAVQLASGFNFDFTLVNKKAHLIIQAGWEFNTLFSVNKMQHYQYRYEDENFYRENGDLTLQGLTVNARFDF
ncbi:MAG: hypothetical protein JXA94_07435 [Parachlamydiales bacterium]|nr:hypothetical protein [Parachlamydiales bacterium]